MREVFRRPVNQTALMQHLQRLVGSGHYYWCADVIPAARLMPFAEKWSAFALTADIPARAYRKKCGKASVHLCLAPVTEDEESAIPWWMLSTEGKLGLASTGQAPGVVQDCRRVEGRLKYGHYELVRLSKKKAEQGAPATWTWRLAQQRYREWEAILVERIKARDLPGLAKVEQCLVTMPMFSGVREQVKHLLVERDKFAGKLKLPLPPSQQLPVMRMVKLWG